MNAKDHLIRVADLLPKLYDKQVLLKKSRRQMVAEGKPWSEQLQGELNLIAHIIYKLERYGELQGRVEKAEKRVIELQEEKRQWMQRIQLLSIDVRELTQEVRNLGVSEPKQDGAAA
jgi:type II secretory pathway component PulF